MFTILLTLYATVLHTFSTEMAKSMLGNFLLSIFVSFCNNHIPEYIGKNWFKTSSLIQSDFICLETTRLMPDFPVQFIFLNSFAFVVQVQFCRLGLSPMPSFSLSIMKTDSSPKLINSLLQEAIMLSCSLFLYNFGTWCLHPVFVFSNQDECLR